MMGIDIMFWGTMFLALMYIIIVNMLTPRP